MEAFFYTLMKKAPPGQPVGRGMVGVGRLLAVVVW